MWDLPALLQRGTTGIPKGRQHFCRCFLATSQCRRNGDLSSVYP
ncbi:unnamed protein product [Amoebophrya sp. A120]|nr:unnamed protein product [Amoebophrya sp. A120]|eukprot:GSA120T00014079001.1